MKKHLLLFSFLLSNFAYAQFNFQRLYGGVNHERGQTLLETYNNRYLFNGATTSHGQGSADAIMIKTDNAGLTLWSKVYGETDFDNSEFAIETADRGYLGIGRTTTPGTSGTDAWVFKVDSNGVLLWSKTYGNNGLNDGFVQGIPALDGGFTFIGNSRSLGAGSDDVFLVHTDAGGDTIFTRSFGSVESESGIGIIQTANGDYVICGRQQTFPNGIPRSDGLIIRTDFNGNMLWSKLYGDSLWEEFEAVRELPNGNLVIAGSTTSFGQGNYDVLVVQTDNVGTLISDFAYGGGNIDAAYDLILNPDQSLVLSGYTEGLGYGHRMLGNDSTNIFLMKVQLDGTLDWMMTYGDGLIDEAYRCAKTSDGGYMVSGYTNDYTPADSSQMLFIKTDTMGLTGCHEILALPIYSSVLMPDTLSGFMQSAGVNIASVNTIEATVNTANNDACLYANVTEGDLASSFSVYPNPFTNEIHIDLNGLEATSITLFAADGKLIANKILKNETKILFNTSDISAGIYFLKVQTSTGTQMVKLIK